MFNFRISDETVELNLPLSCATNNKHPVSGTGAGMTGGKQNRKHAFYMNLVLLWSFDKIIQFNSRLAEKENLF